MQIKKGFKLRDVCGEKVVVSEGFENINFSKLINLNETAAFLWENLIGKDFSIEDMVDVLTSEYEVPAEVAYADCQELVSKWREAGLLD